MSAFRSRRITIIALLVLSALAVAASSAWLVISWAQSSQRRGNQNQQTQMNRLEIRNPAPAPQSANTKDNTRQMPDTNEEKKSKAGLASAPFYAALEEALKSRGMSLDEVCSLDDAVSRRVLEDYGAMFVASDSVTPPPVCMFETEVEALAFQNNAGFKSAIVGGAKIDLQPAAMDALLAARVEARKDGLDITPRGGTEAARRSYSDTQRLWNTRFLPALVHWNQLGRLTKEQVAYLKSLPIHDQVREVLELEKKGIFFNTDFSKSILYSIAAPGTSQHMSMLALDVSQFTDARVRNILARHGWFQTVKSDMPHFTFLGLKEEELTSRGLMRVKIGAQVFWIPNVGLRGEERKVKGEG